jgi:methyl-accepting chemotaxis protein
MMTRNKFIMLASLGLFIIAIIGVWSLRYVVIAVSSLTAEIEQTTRELSSIEAMATDLATLSVNIHHYIPDKDNHACEACDASRAAVHRILDNLIAQDSDPGVRSFPALLHGSFGSVETSMNRLFSLKDPAGRDRESARRLLLEISKLVAFINADISVFRKGKIDAHAGQIAARARVLQTSIVLVVVMTFLITTVLLLGSAIYIYRSVSVPLNILREGVREFGRGNLDYRLHVQGSDDITLIAEQLNDMADSLKRSRRELEDKLSDNANALAAVRGQEIAVRHEINNPLTTVIGNVELLIERYEHKDEDLIARLEVILNNALRIAETTKRLQQNKKGNIGH